MLKNRKNININLQKVQIYNYFIFLFICLLVFEGCTGTSGVKIALSKGSGSSHYENYEKWLISVDDNITVIDLYAMDHTEAIEVLNLCSGIVLTGGPDVHPRNYGKDDDSSRCSIDLIRDTLEFELIKHALDQNLPILGICRGEQILNVALGGSLIVDIPSDFDTSVVHRSNEPDKCFHIVEVVKGSLLNELSGASRVNVNSNHHQAVDILADELKVSARTSDGLIEAFEWKNPSGKPFMIAVQWHPERLEPDNPLSKPIAKMFLEKAKAYLEVVEKR